MSKTFEELLAIPTYKPTKDDFNKAFVAARSAEKKKMEELAKTGDEKGYFEVWVSNQLAHTPHDQRDWYEAQIRATYTRRTVNKVKLCELCGQRPIKFKVDMHIPPKDNPKDEDLSRVCSLCASINSSFTNPRQMTKEELEEEYNT